MYESVLVVHIRVGRCVQVCVPVARPCARECAHNVPSEVQSFVLALLQLQNAMLRKFVGTNSATGTAGSVFSINRGGNF